MYIYLAGRLRRVPRVSSDVLEAQKLSQDFVLEKLTLTCRLLQFKHPFRDLQCDFRFCIFSLSSLTQ